MTLASTSIPALVALICKFALLGYAARTRPCNRTTQLFLVLLVVLSIQNLVEFVGFNEIAQGNYAHANLIGRLYFAMVIPFLAILLHLSLRLSYDPPRLGHLERRASLIYLPAAVLELLLLGDQLVAGFRPFEYTLLREPGSLYFLFETYATVYMLAALVNLIYGARASRSSLARTRNRLWLFSLLPIVLLVVYLVVANHFGWTKLTSTFYLPIAITFFLIVTAYATYEYRLFEIEFYMPWSRVRKRKTAFYERIQATIAEIADLKSVTQILNMLANALHCQVALIGGPRPVLALASGQQMYAKKNLLVSEFPRAALRNVDHIVVANEIEGSVPGLFGLMRQHKVGAIVPFNLHSATSAHWMLLGEHFSDQVYTPLDFKVVETLFERIAELFLDNMLLLRSQLAEASDELRDYQRRLTVAWTELESLRKTLARTEEDNKALRQEKANLIRQSFHVVESGLPDAIESGERTLAEYLAESECEIVRAALRDSGGSRIKAARLLGIRSGTLHYLIRRHNIEPGEGN
jgi:N-terminal 7TM region of histidine kinase/Bacterial regulatory protein, Fis family